ncbi:hypothetical protein EBU71_20975 [bacterium]|nr:hypothetical protein [Candidatus Elulimicrobium humile]
MFSPELNNWKATFTDPLGHQISSNVKRGSESVYNALVDLLILSKSNILNSDHSSTFLKSAILLSGGNVNQKYRRW